MRTLQNLCFAASLALVASAGMANDATKNLTPSDLRLSAKGEDIRTVLSNLFDQAKVQYALENLAAQALYVHVEGITFERAVDILTRLADITITQRDGIYFVTKGRARSKTVEVRSTTLAQGFAPSATYRNADSAISPVKARSVPKPEIASKAPALKQAPYRPILQSTPAPKETPIPKATTSEKPIFADATLEDKATGQKQTASKSTKTTTTEATGTLTQKQALAKRVTSRLQKTDLRLVFAQFAEQTGVAISVDASVPNYKIDAFMFNTSLKFALDRICEAAGLTYTFTEGKTVQIKKA